MGSRGSGVMILNHAENPHFRGSVTYLAPTPPPESARSGRRGEHLDTAPQLRRNRPLAPESRDGIAIGGAAECAVPRTQRLAHSCGVCADVCRTLAFRSGAELRAPGCGGNSVWS